MIGPVCAVVGSGVLFSLMGRASTVNLGVTWGRAGISRDESGNSVSVAGANLFGQKIRRTPGTRRAEEETANAPMVVSSARITALEKDTGAST